jgi:hypothetical protein
MARTLVGNADVVERLTSNSLAKSSAENFEEAGSMED